MTKTVLNNSIVNNETIINNKIINNSNQTILNSNFNPSSSLKTGSIINGKYKIISKMDVNSGEADLYLCKYNHVTYVAKVYRREASIKQEVVNALKSIDSPNVAKFFDTGLHEGLTYEILPYYKDGSLQNKKISFDDLKNIYIPAINEGLKCLHDKKIIHKDLKPSNIMYDKQTGNVAIIDFGISSVRNSGVTMLVTQTGMTPIYSAPETFRNVYLNESDYYSFGITLYELYTGSLPYEGLGDQDLERLISVQRIPLPDEMPKDLKELILGLTYNDISNRNKKNNPNRRWGYQEVTNWLKGIKQVIPGEGISKNNILPFKFLNKEYTDVQELSIALLKNWNEGKKQLFRGNLSLHLKGIDQKLFKICCNAENKAASTSGQDDYIFWETMYLLNPSINKLYWKGMDYNNLPSFGRLLLEKLQTNQDLSLLNLETLIKNHVLSIYFKNLEPEKEKKYTFLYRIEDNFMKSKTNKKRQLKYLYILGFSLSGQKVMNINGVSFVTLNELNEYMQELFDTSFENLQEFCHLLINFEEELDPQFEAWLITLGRSDKLKEWQQWLKHDDDIGEEIV